MPRLMELGIDLGTTRTIVAIHDRGNFPVVAFSGADGDLVDYYPTVSADLDGELVHGLDAEAAEREGVDQVHVRRHRLQDGPPDARR